MTRNGNRTEEARGEIEQTVRDYPWMTHQQVADHLDVSRSWVSDVIGDSDELQAVRDAYRKGIELEACDQTLLRLADVVDLNPRGEETVATRLRESAENDDVEVVHVELQPYEVDE